MIPPFQEYLHPFLSLMGDGKARNLSQICEGLSKTMNLTEEELSEVYETSGKIDITAAVDGHAHGI